MIKKSCNLIGQEAHLATSNNSASLRYYLPLKTISMHKIGIWGVSAILKDFRGDPGKGVASSF